MTDHATDAARIATGLQLASLDRRDADTGKLLADLNAAQLRDVISELLTAWRDIVRWNYRGAEIRAAVAADAAWLAGQHDHEGEQP